MPDRAWKRNERDTAKALGGKRRPHDGTGGVDVEHPLFCVECKYRKHLPKLIMDGLAQARRNVKGDQVPLLEIKERYQRGAIVCMYRSDFIDLMGMIAWGGEDGKDQTALQGPE